MAMFRYSSDIAIVISAFIYSFIAANYLGPEKYGLITYLMGFIAGIPLIFGFEAFGDIVKVYLARYKSKTVFLRVILVAVVILLIILFFILLVSQSFVQFLNKGNVELVTLVSFTIIIIPITPILNSVFIGFKQFGKILKLTILEKVLDIVFLLFFLFVINADLLAVFFGKMCSIIIVIIFSLWLIRKLPFEKKSKPFAGIKKFSSQSAIANVFKGLSIQLELWVFGSILSIGAFGIFYLVKRISSYFFEAPQSAISEVILPFLSEEESKEKLVIYTSKVIKFQLLFNFILFFCFLVIIPFVLIFLFPKYAPGIIIMPIIAVGFFFNFLSPASRLLKAINKNSIIAVGFFINLVIILSLGFILVPLLGIVGAAIIFSITKVIFNGVIVLSCYKFGYRLQLIPRREDIVFFIASTKKVFHSFLKRRS